MKSLFSRRWFQLTLIVLAALAVLVRLGFWQLDRLAQRRTFNERVLEQKRLPALELTGAALAADLETMEYRVVVVTGEFDPAYQVALRNQAYHMNLGGRLLNPLRIQGSEWLVLVDRGWIPQDDLLSGRWERFDEPGVIQVRGQIRRAQSEPDLGALNDPIPAAGEAPLRIWNLANVPAIAGQTPYSLLPVYIQRLPDPQNPPPVVVQSEAMRAPYPEEPALDLSEGNHESYALQWFSFAAILAVGYPFYVLREERQKSSG